MAGENIANHNSIDTNANTNANAWQNMAAKVQEATKNLNKYNIGKRALRAAIVALTAATLAGASVKSESNKVKWAESPTSIDGDLGTGGTIDMSPNTDEEAAEMLRKANEANGASRENGTASVQAENPWADNGATPMSVTPDLPPNAVQH